MQIENCQRDDVDKNTANVQKSEIIFYYQCECGLKYSIIGENERKKSIIMRTCLSRGLSVRRRRGGIRTFLTSEAFRMFSFAVEFRLICIKRAGSVWDAF